MKEMKQFELKILSSPCVDLETLNLKERQD